MGILLPHPQGSILSSHWGGIINDLGDPCYAKVCESLDGVRLVCGLLEATGQWEVWMASEGGLMGHSPDCACQQFSSPELGQGAEERIEAWYSGSISK